MVMIGGIKDAAILKVSLLHVLIAENNHVMYSSKAFEKIESASITLHIVCGNYLNTKLNTI